MTRMTRKSLELVMSHPGDGPVSRATLSSLLVRRWQGSGQEMTILSVLHALLGWTRCEEKEDISSCCELLHETTTCGVWMKHC